jgi:hypothetical protein
MLFIQNFISRYATLLFQIFSSKVGGNNKLCSQNDILEVYESFKCMLPKKDKQVLGSLEKSPIIFIFIFQSFGRIPNESGVCWKLVLDLLICGVRLCSEKKARLSEYELSVVLLHFWGMSKNLGSQAESRFKNQNLITRALVGNDSSSAHEGA